MNPKVSVIMSVYNGEKHIRRAINSILQQTFTDFEFIIANDGSTDATGKILSEYQNKDHRIVLVNQQNIGLTKTLNKLINLTTGEYIARQDADDVSLPERLALEVNFLNKNRDTVMVGSWYDVYFNSNIYWRVCPKPDYKSICNYLKKGINCFMHSSTMFKKSVIQKFAGPYRFRSLIFIKKLFIISIILVLLVISSDLYLSLFKTTPLIMRLQNYQSLLEARSRMELQKYAFELFITYPQGLLLSGVAWEDAIVMRDPSIFSIWGREIAPHNGYFTFALPLGLLYLAGVIIILYYLIVSAIDTLRNKTKILPNYNIYNICVPMTFCLISLLLYAILHNASLFSLEPASILAMYFVLSFQSYSKRCFNHPSDK